MPENEIKAEEDISPSMNLEENTISDHGEQSEEPTKTKLQETIDFFRDLAIIFIVVIFVRTFIAAPFQISGSSMEESYHDGEFILVNKFSYADF
jgi:hypothetical protein